MWSLTTARFRPCVRIGLIVLSFLGSVRTTAAEDTAGAGVTNQGQTDGMRVYVDPATGAFAPDPVGNAAPRAARVAATPVVVPGQSEAGGVEIQLNRRFHSALQGTVRQDGEVQVDCDAPAQR